MRLAGLLHDVGKIGVPDVILNKPAALTDDEYRVMRPTPCLATRSSKRPTCPQEARWVRHHHERVDGAGYPDGLAGEAIPLESRIILVADAYEAMTSDRPYRTAPGQAFAIREFGSNAGTQFDPTVVEALTPRTRARRTRRVRARGRDLRGLRLSARGAPAGRRCRRPG